jgi:hypothetical protein
MLSVTYKPCRYAEFRYAEHGHDQVRNTECRYAEYRYVEFGGFK